MPSYYFHTVQSGIFLDHDEQAVEGVASSACERRVLPSLEAAKSAALGLADRASLPSNAETGNHAYVVQVTGEEGTLLFQTVVEGGASYDELG